MENQKQGWIRVVPDEEYRSYKNESTWRLKHDPRVWVQSPLGLQIEVELGSQEHGLCELFNSGLPTRGERASSLEGRVRPELWAEALFVLGYQKEFNALLAVNPACVAYFLALDFGEGHLPAMLLHAQSLVRIFVAKSAAQVALAFEITGERDVGQHCHHSSQQPKEEGL